MRITEKGSEHRSIDLHFAATEALGQYVEKVGITRGALFRPRKGPKSNRLANKRLTEAGMHKTPRGYLEKLPGAMVSEEDAEGCVTSRCIY